MHNDLITHEDELVLALGLIDRLIVKYNLKLTHHAIAVEYSYLNIREATLTEICCGRILARNRKNYYIAFLSVLDNLCCKAEKICNHQMVFDVKDCIYSIAMAEIGRKTLEEQGRENYTKFNGNFVEFGK